MLRPNFGTIWDLYKSTVDPLYLAFALSMPSFLLWNMFLFLHRRMQHDLMVKFVYHTARSSRDE